MSQLSLRAPSQGLWHGEGLLVVGLCNPRALPLVPCERWAQGRLPGRRRRVAPAVVAAAGVAAFHPGTFGAAWGATSWLPPVWEQDCPQETSLPPRALASPNMTFLGPRYLPASAISVCWSCWFLLGLVVAMFSPPCPGCFMLSSRFAHPCPWGWLAFSLPCVAWFSTSFPQLSKADVLVPRLPRPLVYLSLIICWFHQLLFTLCSGCW